MSSFNPVPKICHENVLFRFINISGYVYRGHPCPQIQEKKYADRYRLSNKKIILMGINFDSEKRNVTEWKVIEE
jgi:hypothetical protein